MQELSSQFVVIPYAFTTVGYIIRILIQVASVQGSGRDCRVVYVKGTVSFVILGLDKSSNSACGCCCSIEDIFPFFGQNDSCNGYISAVQ